MIFKSSLLLFVMAAILASLNATAEVILPRGELRPATYADFKDHPSDSKTYNEFWTFTFHLDGGSVLFWNFSRANLGTFMDPVCGMNLSLLGFHGKDYNLAREYPKSNFQFHDQEQRLNIHKNIWFGGKLPDKHELFLDTKKDGKHYQFHLKLSDIDPGYVWGDGIFKVGGEKIGIFFHIPRAKVRGTLSINGKKSEVSGWASMDHTFQTEMGTKLVNTGFRYHSLEGPTEVASLVLPLSEHGTIPLGYGLKKTGGGYRLLRPQSVSRQEMKTSRDIPMPHKLVVEYEDSITIVLRGSDRQQISVLHEFSGITKWAVKKFMGGELWHYRGISPGGKYLYNFFGVD